MSEQALKAIVKEDFKIWLESEMNKLDMDVDHFGDVLLSVMYGETEN
ncbi:MAG: hypothetical protein J6B01_04520 [Ruminococcus sp.]|nr:hypothetical protein [Ruminococcus sp.]